MSGPENWQYPEKPHPDKWLVPPYVPSVPYTHKFATYEIPAPSSMKSNRALEYFPETDTFYLAGSNVFEPPGGKVYPAYEFWVEKSDNPEGRKELHANFWEFRDSARRELKKTGQLHWRRTDRWGMQWSKGNWRGEKRPVWIKTTKTWDDNAVREGVTE